MAVVPFPNLPPQGPSAGNPWELRSLTGINRSPLNAVATSLERAGAHFALRLPYANLATDRRARLQTFGMSCRGSANRFYVPVFGWIRRGSFPAPELLTNNTFASGTTGWSNPNATLIGMTASDGLLRHTRLEHSAGITSHYNTGSKTVTQYAPYAARSIDHLGRGTASSYGPQLGTGPGDATYGRANAVGNGLKTLVSVLPATTALYGLVDLDTGLNMAGDFINVSHTSFARCALVDNGPNLMQQSDSPEHANWTKSQTTASAVAGTAPDGAADASAIIEDTNAGQHRISQSRTRASQAEDLCAYGYFKRRTGTRDVQLLVQDGGGTNYAFVKVSLANGTIIDGPTVSGTATNARAFVRDAGSGWYFCSLVARIPASVTASIGAYLVSGGTDTYTGDGSSSIYGWRLGVARSSVPTRGMQTTTAGDDDGTLQTGGALHLKGLPASTNGLLLQGDPAEIIIGTTSQLVRARASLDSDAAGLGYFQFEPPLRVSPLDNAAVIVCNPLCKMMMENNVAGWTDRMGGLSDLEFAAVEDTYPS